MRSVERSESQETWCLGPNVMLCLMVFFSGPQRSSLQMICLALLVLKCRFSPTPAVGWDPCTQVGCASAHRSVLAPVPAAPCTCGR